MTSASLIRKLETQGWQMVRVKGSHHMFKHPFSGELIVIPHPEKDVPKGLLKSIMKQAGLKR